MPKSIFLIDQFQQVRLHLDQIIYIYIQIGFFVDEDHQGF